MKVLMSAYACEPGKGSEPGAGWAWARAAALNHDVWVLTRENNRESIEAALQVEPELNLHPVYLDLPLWARWWKRGQRGVRLYYVLWQWQARKVATRLHAEHRFDVAHHITFAVDWLPAGVVGIPGLPAVWGPVGGTAPFPWKLMRWLGARGVLDEILRLITGAVGRKLYGDRAAKRASLVLAQNREVAARFASNRTLIQPNAAITVAVAQRSQTVDQDLRLAVFVGRLIPWKGVAIAIAALAEPGAADWRLRILGEGRDRGRLERLTERLGVSDRVEFCGLVPREDVFAVFGEASLLLFPSIHDSSPWAVAEALSVGLPVVCLDACGPPVLVERCNGGIAVQPNRSAPAALAMALQQVRKPLRIDALLAGRLPHLISGFYERAIERDGAQHGQPEPK